MIEWNEHYIVKHHIFYHRLMFVLVLIVALFTRLFHFTEDNGKVIIFMSIIAVFWGLEFVFNKLTFFDSEKLCLAFKYIEIIVFGILQTFISNNLIILALLCMLTSLLAVEYCVLTTDYEKSSVFVRRVLLGVSYIINIGTALISKNESEWVCYVLLQIFSIAMVLFIVDWLVALNSDYEEKKNKLIVEKNDIESTNEKLIDYQNRVKAINEQINYQKIDLARAIKELEQVNMEMQSQTEVMKYMASTFDIVKCIEVITDAIVDVKQSKLCALYVDKDVYMNKTPSLVVKTNYTSLERRIKKNIDSLYKKLADNSKFTPSIYIGNDVKQFDFIGDININSLALIPLMDEIRMFGLMIVGSDKEDFFDKGLNYYESCIVEFGVAIKSSNLYLKTQDMARKDGLTGIYNRLYFKELFADAASLAVKNNMPISVALFDIDKFKNVNDTYGHLMGDEVIKMVAHVSETYAEKNGGFACRYGGEEFLIVLPGFDEKQALPILEDMHETIKTTGVRYNDMEIFINVCIGYSTYPSLCDDVYLLVSRADRAMYYGKRNGRGRLIMDSPSLNIEE